MGNTETEKRIKYTILGVQQKKLLKLNEKTFEKYNEIFLNITDEKEIKNKKAEMNLSLFDIKDAVILNYVKDVYGRRNIITKIVDGEIFKYIDHDKINEYVPLLNLNSQKSISRRFKKYEDSGLICRHQHSVPDKKDGGFKGSYTFIHLKESFYNLFEMEKNDYSDFEFEEKLKEMGLAPERTEMSADAPDRNVCSDKKNKTSEKPVNSKRYSTTSERTEMSADNTINTIINNTTTKEPEKSSSSLEIYLKEKGYDSKTISNISKLDVTLERVKEVITHADKKNMGIGYIVDALKNGYEIPKEKQQPKKELSGIRSSAVLGEKDLECSMSSEEREHKRLESEVYKIVKGSKLSQDFFKATLNLKTLKDFIEKHNLKVS